MWETAKAIATIPKNSLIINFNAIIVLRMFKNYCLMSWY